MRSPLTASLTLVNRSAAHFDLGQSRVSNAAIAWLEVQEVDGLRLNGSGSSLLCCSSVCSTHCFTNPHHACSRSPQFRLWLALGLAGAIGSPAQAAAAEMIEFTVWANSGHGNLSDICYVDGSMARYAYLDQVLVQQTDYVG